jgi:hypothetical protein
MMKYIFVLIILLCFTISNGQNNLIPNPGFENALPNRSPQCNYDIFNNSPTDIEEDIADWKNGKRTTIFNDDYRKSTPDWNLPLFSCFPVPPFVTSRHIYLEEKDNQFEDAIRAGLKTTMQPNKSYIFKITYATGTRESPNQPTNFTPTVKVWFTKFAEHWSSNWGNVKYSFNMYPLGSNAGWVQHWEIINLGSAFNNNDLNNIVLDCSGNHAYIDYVEFSRKL